MAQALIKKRRDTNSSIRTELGDVLNSLYSKNLGLARNASIEHSMLYTELNKTPPTHLTSNSNPNPPPCHGDPSISNYIPLDRTDTLLLVDVAISLFLLAVLEKHGGSEDERYVDTYDTEGSCEDDVEEVVCEAHEWGHAADVRCCYEGSRADGVRDEERWRCGVVVAAAVELLPISIHLCYVPFMWQEI